MSRQQLVQGFGDQIGIEVWRELVIGMDGEGLRFRVTGFRVACGQYGSTSVGGSRQS